MSSPPGYQDPFETWSAKFSRKIKENPWVPIGCLATCGALAMSAAKLRAGKSSDMNFWLRARVVLQGLTLVALLAGSMSIQKIRKEELARLNIGEDGLPQIEATTELAREKKEKERLGFEERLKAAQATTEMEEGLARRVVKGPAVHRERREDEPHPAANATTAAVKKSESWRWWSKSGGSGSQESSS